MATIKHKKVSEIPDSADPDIIQPSNWNEDHGTELSGILKGSGGEIAVAVLETDYSLNLISITAGETIGGHRVARVANNIAYYASNDVAGHMRQVVGISIGAAAIGDIVQIRTFGEMQELSWAWDIEKYIYLGSNGLLTQTYPSSGFGLIVAKPIAATKIFINIEQPIILG